MPTTSMFSLDVRKRRMVKVRKLWVSGKSIKKNNKACRKRLLDTAWVGESEGATQNPIEYSFNLFSIK